MSDSEKKALELIAKAEKELLRSKAKRFLWNFYGIGHDHKRAAMDCYKEAVALFKIARQWTKAGETYMKLADYDLKMKLRYGAALNYANAANCYKKNGRNNLKEAMACMEKAIELNLKQDDLVIAARNHMSIAVALEHAGDLERAIFHYGKAADYFQVEDLTSSANSVLDNVNRLKRNMKS